MSPVIDRQPVELPSPEISVFRVPPTVLPAFWPRAAPLLVRGLEYAHGRYNLADIKEWLKAGSHELWGVFGDKTLLAVLLTEISTHPSGKRQLNLLLAAGAGARLWVRPAYEKLVEHMRLHSATEFRVVGRRGWLRHLKPLGFAQEAIVLTREV